MEKFILRKTDADLDGERICKIVQVREILKIGKNILKITIFSHF